MADIDMDKLIDVIKEKMKEQNMNANKIALASGLEYSTVSDALNRNHPPKLDTLQKIIRTLGYELSEIIDAGGNILRLNDVDDMQFRNYRKLNDKYQEMIWTDISAYLLLQEQENIARAKAKKEASKAARRNSCFLQQDVEE